MPQNYGDWSGMTNMFQVPAAAPSGEEGAAAKQDADATTSTDAGVVGVVGAEGSGSLDVSAPAYGYIDQPLEPLEQSLQYESLYDMPLQQLMQFEDPFAQDDMQLMQDDMPLMQDDMPLTQDDMPLMQDFAATRQASVQVQQGGAQLQPQQDGSQLQAQQLQQDGAQPQLHQDGSQPQAQQGGAQPRQQQPQQGGAQLQSQQPQQVAAQLTTPAPQEQQPAAQPQRLPAAQPQQQSAAQPQQFAMQAQQQSTMQAQQQFSQYNAQPQQESQFAQTQYDAPLFAAADLQNQQVGVQASSAEVQMQPNTQSSTPAQMQSNAQVSVAGGQAQQLNTQPSASAQAQQQNAQSSAAGAQPQQTNGQFTATVAQVYEPVVQPLAVSWQTEHEQPGAQPSATGAQSSAASGQVQLTGGQQYSASTAPRQSDGRSVQGGAPLAQSAASQVGRPAASQADKGQLFVYDPAYASNSASAPNSVSASNRERGASQGGTRQAVNSEANRNGKGTAGNSASRKESATNSATAAGGVNTAGGANAAGGTSATSGGKGAADSSASNKGKGSGKNNGSSNGKGKGKRKGKGADKRRESSAAAAYAGYPVSEMYQQPAQQIAYVAAEPKKSRGWVVAIVVVVCLFAFAAFCVKSCTDLFGGGYVASAPLNEDAVAVIELDGTIQYDGSACSPEGFKELLDAASDDEHVKAVVLRVNSGGGTATAGEEMASYLRDFDKPVVVSSASINASAAYEISSQADYIYVAKSTEIGAIGTAMELTDLSGLLDMLGVDVEVITSADSKDSSYGYRPLTDEERAYYQRMIDQINETFIENVSEGRGIPIEQVRTLATGLSFTGIDAVENGLADEIGTREDAIDRAAKLAGLTEYATVDLGYTDYDLSGLYGMLGSSEETAPTAPSAIS